MGDLRVDLLRDTTAGTWTVTPATAVTLLEEQNSGGDERTSAWGRASVCRLHDVERELSCRETVVCARCLGNGSTRRRVN